MRIIFVTYNLAFISNWIVRLKPYLNNCEIIVLHIASLQNAKPLIVEGLKYIDVSGHSGLRLKKVINDLKPDLCITFNFRSLFEQVILRICKEINIPNVYIEHGLISMNTTRFKKNKIKEDFFNTIHRQLNFIWKYMTYIFSSEKPFLEIKVLYFIYLKSQFFHSEFDHYFIFSQRSFDKLNGLYKLSCNYTYIGYPIFNSKEEKEIADNCCNSGGGVLYVHQPFILDRLTTISYNEEKNYLMRLANVLAPKYNEFTILLHPRENIAKYRELYSESNITIEQSPNNFRCFSDKDLIMGHYSTALLYALYFNKPTVILDYPDTVVDKIFLGYFDFVANIEELKNHKFEQSKVSKDYIVGHNNTYEQIAEQICYYINNVYPKENN